MKILVAALVLISVTIAHGERCRFKVPVTTSNLKCGDQVYHRSPKAIAAYNECGAGKNGSEITPADLKCIYEKQGLAKNGSLIQAAVTDDNKQKFPHHYEAIDKGIQECGEAYSNSGFKDAEKHVDCNWKVYEDVCKHKTCDWINTLD